jgi:hypothetical protein
VNPLQKRHQGAKSSFDTCVESPPVNHLQKRHQGENHLSPQVGKSPPEMSGFPYRHTGGRAAVPSVCFRVLRSRDPKKCTGMKVFTGLLDNGQGKIFSLIKLKINKAERRTKSKPGER